MRVKRGFVNKRKHNKIFKLAKGFKGRRKNCYSLAKDAVHRSLVFATRDRRTRKRDFRRLWNIRISAACKALGTSYSRFIYGLKKANISLDRKILANIAASDTNTFAELVKIASAKDA
ncbi:MAG: 50S ribosomal protein L20 [Bdellovibrionota bacterium]